MFFLHDYSQRRMNSTPRFLVIVSCITLSAIAPLYATESCSQSVLATRQQQMLAHVEPTTREHSVLQSSVSLPEVLPISSTTGSQKRIAQPLLRDDFAELDDPKDSSTNSNDRLIATTLESARQQYVRALSFIEQADTASAARSFEKAIGILNRIVSFPEIEDNTDFTDLAQSIIEDYESYIQSIDALDENTSMFILRDKIFQAIETAPSTVERTPVERIAPAPVTPYSATGNTSSTQQNTIPTGKSNMPTGIGVTTKSGDSHTQNNNEQFATKTSDKAGTTTSSTPAMSYVHTEKKDEVISGVRVNSSLKLERTASNITTITGMDGRDIVIDFSTNDYVDKALEFLTQNRGRDFFRRCLERAGKWFPMMRQIAREEGVPEELIYHTIIESGLDPNAVSRTAAVGFWQFMKPTASDVNLTVNFWLDERRDPEKSTRAGMRYMRMLYNELGDWHLAIAAYNCGLGRVRRAVQKHGKENPTYWEIRSLLPRETRNHVPLFIAAGKIAMSPETFGFSGIEFAPPFRYDVFTVREAVDLSAIAQCANVSLDDLQDLNPELVQSTTPPNVDEFPVKIPSGMMNIVAENFAKLPDEVKRSWVLHTVRGTESLKTIAKKYNVAQQTIIVANDLNGKKKRLTQGMQLRIPLTLNSQERTLALTKPATKADDKSLPQRVLTEQSDNTLVASTQSEKVSSEKSSTLPSLTNGTTSVDQEQGSSNEVNNIKGTHDTKSKDLKASNAKELSPESTQAMKPATQSNPVSGEQQIKALRDNPTITSNKALIKPDFIVSTAPAGKVVTHRVRKGETLYNIANRYGVRIADVRNWNNLSYEDDNVREGMVLTIRATAANTMLLNRPTTSRTDEEQAATPTTSDRITDTEEDTTPTRVNLSKTKLPTIVQHKVRKGETLAQIADEYGIPVAIIRKASNLKKRAKVTPGQILRIPTLTAPDHQIATNGSTKDTPSKDKEISTTNDGTSDKTLIANKDRVKDNTKEVSTKATQNNNEQPRSNTAYLLHTVKSGETIYRIAQRYGVKADDIQRWNVASIKNDRLSIGDQIKIYTEPTGKGGATTVTSNREEEQSTTPKTYKIQSGDTIFSIAKRFGVSVDALKKMNPRLSENRIREGQTLRLQ